MQHRFLPRHCGSLAALAALGALCVPYSAPPAPNPDREKIISIFEESVRLDEEFNAALAASPPGGSAHYFDVREKLEHFRDEVFEPVLDGAVDLVCADKDEHVAESFVATVPAAKGSANEALSWTLARMWVCQPDLIETEMRKHFATDGGYLLDELEWGFKNVTYGKEAEVPRYRELKQRLESLWPTKK